MEYVSWTRMEDGDAESYALLERCEQAYEKGHVDRLLAQLTAMDVDFGGYRVTRYGHSLQCATLAQRDGAEEEMVIAALLHDIGDIIAPYNHSELAAAVLKPYVSERIRWIVLHHGLFQGYYFHHHLGGDRLARERYKDHPWYDDCVYFCHNYDQNAFDPNYDTLPLEFFEPIVRRVFARAAFQHQEVQAAE